MQMVERFTGSFSISLSLRVQVSGFRGLGGSPLRVQKDPLKGSIKVWGLRV